MNTNVKTSRKGLQDHRVIAALLTAAHPEVENIYLPFPINALNNATRPPTHTCTSEEIV